MSISIQIQLTGLFGVICCSTVMFTGAPAHTYTSAGCARKSVHG